MRERRNTVESVFISTFKTNPAQLKEIFKLYECITGLEIETTIKNEFTEDDFKIGLLTIGEQPI